MFLLSSRAPQTPGPRGAGPPLPPLSSGLDTFTEKHVDLNQVIYGSNVPIDVESLENIQRTFGDNTLKTNTLMSVIRNGHHPNNRKRNKYAADLAGKYHIAFGGLGLSDECVREAQQCDAECTDMIHYLTLKSAPSYDDRANRVFLTEDSFIVSNGILDKIQATLGPNSETYATLEVSLGLRKIVLEMHHDSPLGGHSNAQKMLSTMRQKSYWTSICQDIYMYCQSCDVCAQTKRMTHPVKPPLTLRDPCQKPWHTEY